MYFVSILTWRQLQPAKRRKLAAAPGGSVAAGVWRSGGESAGGNGAMAAKACESLAARKRT